jgi:hypothetical protein
MNDFSSSESSPGTSGLTLSHASRQAKEGLSTCTAYVRENPWVGLAGAAVLGALIVSLVKPSSHKPTIVESLRHLFDDARDKLPTQKEAGSALCRVLKKLHLPV